MPLNPPDSLHLQAALGWLDLGIHAEADAELNKMTEAMRAHPGVLQVRWRIRAAAQKWEAAMDIAAMLIYAAPDLPFGWVQRSHCLHKLKRTEEARDELVGVADQFPDNIDIPYNLACYECQLGNLGRAKQWLEKAFQLGDAKKLKLAALDDPDLEPLWKNIGST